MVKFVDDEPEINTRRSARHVGTGVRTDEERV